MILFAIQLSFPLRKVLIVGKPDALAAGTHKPTLTSLGHLKKYFESSSSCTTGPRIMGYLRDDITQLNDAASMDKSFVFLEGDRAPKKRKSIPILDSHVDLRCIDSTFNKKRYYNTLHENPIERDGSSDMIKKLQKEINSLIEENARWKLLCEDLKIELK